MLNILYRISIQMRNDSVDPAEVYSGFRRFVKPESGEDVENESSTGITVSFRSNLCVSEMIKAISEAMQECGVVLYTDVLYRYQDEMFHDRFTVFSDGTWRDYTSRTYYNEIGERQKIL